jgi:hypothetical protein
LRGKDKRDSKTTDGSFTLPRISTKGWRGRESISNVNHITGPLLNSPYGYGGDHEGDVRSSQEQSVDAYFDMNMDDYHKSGHGYRKDQKRGVQAPSQAKESKSSQRRQQHEAIMEAMKASGFH